MQIISNGTVDQNIQPTRRTDIEPIIIENPHTTIESRATIKKYKLLKTIGKGFYSKVKLAKSLESKKFFAIKIIKRHEVEQINLQAFKKILLNEVHLIQSMNHPNIIKLVEYNCDGEIVIKPSGKAIQVFFIVLELVEQGDLFSFIKVKYKQGGFNERFARYYFQQLISAIEYLHDTAGIVHRDLKPENLLLNLKYELKIADFGLSSRKEGSYGLGIHYSQVGTRQYQAPEVLERRSYRGEYVDIFSMGVILFIMVTGSLPYTTEANINDPLYKFIHMKKRDQFWKAWRKYNQREVCSDVPSQQQQNRVVDSLKMVFKCFKSVGSLIYNKLIQHCKRPNNSQNSKENHKYELGPKEVDKDEVVMDARNRYSDDFKDLVLSMISYHFYDRPSIEKIRNHPWLKGEIPSQDEIIREMAKLKKEFIIKEIQRQSSYFLEQEKSLSELNLPKSFKEYAVYCIKTNNTQALFKGTLKMTSHVCFEFSKSVCKCDCRRRKKSFIFNVTDERKPIWMHSGLFFAHHQKSAVKQDSALSSSGNNNSNPYEKKVSMIKQNSMLKFRGAQITLVNNLASKVSYKMDEISETPNKKQTMQQLSPTKRFDNGELWDFGKGKIRRISLNDSPQGRNKKYI